MSDDTEDILLARIPLQIGEDNRATYLSYRATGFSVAEAEKLTHVTHAKVLNWRRNKDFKAVESVDGLRKLQSYIGRDVIRLEFLRNMRMLLAQDAKTIWRATNDLDAMSDREWSYFKLIRKHYTAGDLLSLAKAIEPDKHATKIEIKLSWDGGQALLDGADEAIDI